MKKAFLPIGLLCLLAWPSPSLAADYCEEKPESSLYKSFYCDLRMNGNREAETQVTGVVAHQLGYDSAMLEWMVAQGDKLSCPGILAYAADSGLPAQKLPEDVQKACGASNALVGLDALRTRLQNAYRKERTIHLNRTRLELSFKASEHYWDGKLDPLSQAPFDLMVDLNLIDRVLFGSRATWINDVFAFPEKSKDSQEGSGQSGSADPASDAPSGADEESSSDASSDSGDPGLALGGVHPDCITAPPQSPALCGNGILDVLAGEACDDGNRAAGDGCSDFCLAEPAGGNAQCRDPEAVTLRPFAQLPSGPGSNPLCPPGSVLPAPQLPLSDESAEPLAEDELPDPFVGGRLKPLPLGVRPACPAGQSEVAVSLAGKQKRSACIPTEFCGNFNEIRELLFGKEWENGEQSSVAESIESAACVEFIQENRPATPYQPNDFCIDCHFRGMADSLEKALASNVSPLQNTTSAFGISNRWGPSFSFDLNVAVRNVPRLKADSKSRRPQSTVQEQIDQSDRKAKQGDSALETTESAPQRLSRDLGNVEKRLESVAQGIASYQEASSSAVDIAFAERVIPLVEDLQQQFSSIQSSVEFMVDSAQKLAVKPLCKL